MKAKILFIVLIFLFSSCSFFRVIPEENYTAQSIKQYEDSGKYLILHRGEEAWHATDLRPVNDSLNMKLDFQLGYHLKYLNPQDDDKTNKYSRKEEPEVTNSIHIYTNDTCFGSFDTLVVIPESSVFAVKSYAYNRSASRASVILPAIFIPLGGVILVIGAAASSADYTPDLSF